jgi:hypothetical protein
MDINQNGGCVWPAAIEEEAPRFGPPDFVVMKKMPKATNSIASGECRKR